MIKACVFLANMPMAQKTDWNSQLKVCRQKIALGTWWWQACWLKLSLSISLSEKHELSSWIVNSESTFGSFLSLSPVYQLWINKNAELAFFSVEVYPTIHSLRTKQVAALNVGSFFPQDIPRSVPDLHDKKTVMIYHIECHVMSCHVMSCPVLSCPVLSCRVVSCCVVLCYVPYIHTCIS